MKKLILIFTILFCTSSGIFAQTESDNIEISRITAEQAIDIATRFLIEQGTDLKPYNGGRAVFLVEKQVWYVTFNFPANKEMIAVAVGGGPSVTLSLSGEVIR